MESEEARCITCGATFGSGPIVVHSLPDGPVPTHETCGVDERARTVAIPESAIAADHDEIRQKLASGWVRLGLERPLGGAPGMKAVYMIPPLG
jgi:hypothetical protein